MRAKPYSDLLAAMQQLPTVPPPFLCVSPSRRKTYSPRGFTCPAGEAAQYRADRGIAV
ncbi:hypothetical protein BDW42DRAFT_189839 [Aspergillus taichungensis]|uniref:Uncharacterized protein n=1 Tax=Aspergillus taichungensis TaxID=482145 RepID=A0A2J5IA04_9EURO|nr:hypothetical protein BDW42DRAFT_189839 [Aspergillus taichungensis]